jgi:alcohol dehydrogenase (cytochrome c)
VVIGGGKMGIVYAMNGANGSLLWKTPVGVHNGHDNDSLKALKGKSTSSSPFDYTPITTPFDYEPGALGGILSDMAVANNTVYVATLNIKFSFTNTSQVNGTPTTNAKDSGNIEALNLATGKVEWNTTVKSVPLGATTVSNNLILTSLVNGHLLALNRSTGKIVKNVTLPMASNAPLAIAGNTIIVEDGGPQTKNPVPQIVAYRVP